MAGAARRRALIVAAAVGTAVLLPACVSERRSPHPDLARIWRDFLALPEERALALGGDPQRDRWVTGSSGGHASREEALEDALGECRRRRALRRVQDACEPYAVGDEIVWVGPQ